MFPLGPLPSGSARDLATTQVARSVQAIRWGVTRLAGSEAGDSIGFVPLGDFTTSLNETRAALGYPVGGILFWGPGNLPLVPAGIGPNHCGMLVAEVDEAVTADQLTLRIERLRTRMPVLEGVPLQWDLGRKNHFLNVYRSSAGRRIAVMHCSLPEAREDGVLGMGHDLRQSHLLRKMVTVLDTPVGPFGFFCDDSASSVLQQAEEYSLLARRKREIICRAVFKDCLILSNENHMRLLDHNAMQFGSYASGTPMRHLPLMVGPGRSAYLVDTKNPVEVFGRTLFLTPHGTGARSSSPDTVEYDAETERHFLTDGTGRRHFRQLAEIFDDHQDDSTVLAPEYERFYRVRETLTPQIETKFL
ncbi:hypothetical protein ACGFZR_00935 [Streptomyces sp. NPDC048241]|uniref:hypothetical protein n=1 Tax=Streptomyces sp. NPDC048241 TaxID=3365521 RepID=UPI00371AD4E6